MIRQDLPTFSIVMPSHNRRDQLTQALNTLSKQTYPAHLLELVVVLDGCQDGSADRVRELQAAYPFKLNLIEQKQAGPGAARNTGIKAAQGEYILFVDDDVMAIPSLVFEHWSIHQKDPRAVVIGTMSVPADYSSTVWMRWEGHILEKQYQDIIEGKYTIAARQFYTGNASLQRRWLLEAGLFDEVFLRQDDVEFGYRIARLGTHFYFNPQAIGYHYAYRPYKSWLKMHYMNGHYLVKLDRDKGQHGIISVMQSELEEERHWLTRLICKLLLDHKRAQRITAYIFLGLAQATSLVKQERLGYKALSCVANLFFCQGFYEELKASPVPTDPSQLKMGA